MPPESSTEEQVSSAAAPSQVDQGAKTADSPAAAPTQDVKAADSSPADSEGAAAAGSPAAGKDAKPRSVLEAVQRAVDSAGTGKSSKPEGEKEPESDKPGAEAAKGTAEAEGELGPLTDEEFHKYGPKTRRRIHQLLDKAKGLEAQVADLGPKAEAFQKMADFVSRAGMTRDEVNQLMEVGALLKSDPFAALEQVRPVYERLLALTGNVLPDDLKQQVDGGYIPEATARELSQRRSREAISAETSKREEESRAVAAERERLTKLADSAANAVAKWETDWQASDPDYQAKRDLVGEKIELAMTRAANAGKLPRSEAEAVALAKKALADVNATFTRLRPQASEIRPNPQGSASPSVAPAPRTMAEAIGRAAKVA